jgi:hypothetical protein
LETRRKAIVIPNEGGASGYLLYLQERTLLARRMDRETLALSGDPVVIAPNVALFPPGFHASFCFVSLDDGSLMRSVVRATKQGFESDPPRVFAQIPVMPVARSPFDVTADGRVLLLERTVNSAALSIVTNWRAAMTP